MVNEIESIRRQLYDLQDVLRSKGSAYKKLVQSASKLDSMLIVTESKLVQLKYTGTGQDDVRYPEMLLGKFGYLAGAIGTADFPPANQHIEVYALLKQRLSEVQKEFDAMIKNDFASFMKALRDQNIEPVVTRWK